MWLANFQTLLLLLQVAVCEADDTSALPPDYSLSPHVVKRTAPPMTAQWDPKRAIDPKVIGSTTVTAYSSWTTWSCPAGSTWTTLIPFAGCRTTASVQAPMYTGCANTSVLLGPFDNTTCTGTGGQISCVTGWIYYNDGVTLTNYECWPTWTQGNWYAWREQPRRLPIATIVSVAVVVPIVIGLVVVGLWWWRRRRNRQRDAELLEGVRKSMTPSTNAPSEPRFVTQTMFSMGGRDTKELEEQRRASELSSSLAPHETILSTMSRFEEERDDASSYHTTESAPARHELQAQQAGNKAGVNNGMAKEENGALQKMLSRFRS